MCESQRKHSWNEARHSSTFKNVTNSFLNTWENGVNWVTYASLLLLFPILPLIFSISIALQICCSHCPKIAGQISFHLLVSVTTVGPKVPMERPMAEKCGFFNGCVYFPRRVDHWHFKGIMNTPLMKLETIISAARLVSGVDTVPRGGASTKIKLPKSKYCRTAQALGEWHLGKHVHRYVLSANCPFLNP